MRDTDEKLRRLLEFIQDHGRVCPRPIDWQDFWESLPAKKQTDAGGSHPCLYCLKRGGEAQMSKKPSGSEKTLSGQHSTTASMLPMRFCVIFRF
jgi:putative hemolysin